MIFIPLIVLAFTSGSVTRTKISAGCAGRAGFSTGTVGVFAGRHTHGNTTTILDLGKTSSLLSWHWGVSTPHRVDLGREGSSLDPSGLARAADGTLCALAHLGRHLRCLDERSGTTAGDRALPTRAQGIWDVAGRLIYADYELRPDRPLLHTEDGKSFSSLRSRGMADSLGTMTANLFTCGVGLAGSTPCWFLASNSVAMVEASGLVREIDLAAQLAPGGRYPLRDATAAADGRFWLLVNDPPASQESLAGDARRLIRYSPSERRFESLELPSAARAILDAGGDSAFILFKDGSAADCRIPAKPTR